MDERAGDLQAQLSTILSEINNLKQEVQGTSLSVATEVKKLKSEKDITWKFQGNKIQYNFNSELTDIVKQSVWALENNKPEYCKEQLAELTDKLHKRNKLIRIADSSTGGWDTVKQYETNPVASDSDDENKIHKAEGRALKRKKTTRGRGAGGYGSTHSFSGHRPGSNVMHFGAPSTGFGRGHPFRASAPYGNGFSYGYGFGGASNLPRPTLGPCFACGEYTHLRRQCPYMRGFPSGSGEQSVGTRKLAGVQQPAQ